MTNVGDIFQRLRDWYISKFGTETADSIFSQYQIDDLKRYIEDASATADAMCSFNSNEGGAAVQKTAKELTLEQALADAQRQISEFSTSQKARDDAYSITVEENKRLKAAGMAAEFSAFCDGLPEQVTPAIKSKAMEFMAILSGCEEFEFAEGDGKVKKPPVEAFKDFLKDLPKAVSFSEFATGDRATKISEADQVVAGIASASPKEGGK
jgi:hypothetical protein